MPINVSENLTGYISENIPNFPDGLNSFSELIKANAAFLDSVGQYQLRQAQILATEVAAEGDLIVVNMKRVALQQLHATYNRLLKEKHKLDRQLYTIDRQIKNASYLSSGESLDADLVPVCWLGIKFLVRLYPIIECSLLSADVKDKSNFWHNRKKQIVEQDAIANNPLQLIEWCYHNFYMPKIGSSAYFSIVSFLELLTRSAQKRIEEIQKYQQELEDNTYKTWNPLEISKLPTNTALSAIPH